VGVRPARPGRPQPPRRDWRRYLGPPNSWRRVILAGIGGGLALAIVGAIIAAAISGGNGGSLAPKATLAPISSDGGSVPVATEAPIDTPTEVPTGEPTLVPTEMLPTETAVVEEPTETPVEEQPTEIPTAEP
jgi:hypothetical protein